MADSNSHTAAFSMIQDRFFCSLKINEGQWKAAKWKVSFYLSDRKKETSAKCSSKGAQFWIKSPSPTITPTRFTSYLHNKHTLTRIPATHLHPHRWRWRWWWWSLRRHPRPRRPHRMPAQTPACYRSRRWWKRGHMPCLKTKRGKKRVTDWERGRETEESYKCVLILSSWT